MSEKLKNDKRPKCQFGQVGDSCGREVTCQQVTLVLLQKLEQAPPATSAEEMEDFTKTRVLLRERLACALGEKN